MSVAYLSCQAVSEEQFGKPSYCRMVVKRNSLYIAKARGGKKGFHKHMLACSET